VDGVEEDTESWAGSRLAGAHAQCQLALPWPITVVMVQFTHCGLAGGVNSEVWRGGQDVLGGLYIGGRYLDPQAFRQCSSMFDSHSH
jgi:hypothetical protein